MRGPRRVAGVRNRAEPLAFVKVLPNPPVPSRRGSRCDRGAAWPGVTQPSPEQRAMGRRLWPFVHLWPESPCASEATERCALQPLSSSVLISGLGKQIQGEMCAEGGSDIPSAHQTPHLRLRPGRHTEMARRPTSAFPRPARWPRANQLPSCLFISLRGRKTEICHPSTGSLLKSWKLPG